MKTSWIATIPKALDILALVLFSTSFFLLSPLGKPLITHKIAEAEYLPNPTLNSQPVPTETSKVTYLPDGHENFEVTLALSIHVSFGLSGEVTYYSVVYRIDEIYNYVDELQSILSISSMYLFVRVIWIIGKKTQIVPVFFGTNLCFEKD